MHHLIAKLSMISSIVLLSLQLALGSMSISWQHRSSCSLSDSSCEVVLQMGWSGMPSDAPSIAEIDFGDGSRIQSLSFERNTIMGSLFEAASASVSTSHA